ncbi:hypothetical protein QR98_0033980 [Sarcoptes scabiei]|uniref:Rnh202 triple barrel domain-containing protein n=1 Tax=Sarcoptes scabiei TaxID=52283 RepID=A0A132A1K8_SARSC|nr:hypothetical protein QR98_0033980 [Sarcoptes scabiei]
MSKIFILPNRNETKAIKLKAIQLKHPRSKSNCTYFIDQDNRYILELCIKANPFHSWFCDDLLLKEDDCEQNLIDLINFYNDRNLKCVCDVKSYTRSSKDLQISQVLTSQKSIIFAFSSVSLRPSKTKPKPQFKASPNPTPPPLCNATQVAPLVAFPKTVKVAISAV